MNVSVGKCVRSVRAPAAAMLVLGGLAACTGSERARPSVGDLEASVRTVDFGAVTLGLGVERSFTVAQRGLLAAEVDRVRLVPDDGVFHVEDAPRAVAEDGTREVRIAYRPLVAGVQRAVLEMTLEDGAPLSVALTGKGVDARAVPENPVTFGRPAVGEVRRRTLSLKNDAETPVPVTLAFVGADADEFTATSELTVPAFGEVSANLTWSPQGRAGSRDVVLRLGACPLCAPMDLAVQADAVASALVFNPNPVDFGGVQIDSERRLPMTVTNATDELLTVSSLVLGASTDPGFSLENVPATIVLPPLDTAQVTVAFSPTRLGLASGSVAVHSDAEPVQDFVVPLVARGGGPQLVVAPDQLAFKPTPMGSRAEMGLTVMNGGADPSAPPLHVTNVTVEGTAFSIVQNVSPGTALAAGQRVTVTVAFSPQAPASYRGRVRVFSDDPLAPEVDVPLTGMGGLINDCKLDVHPDGGTLDFGGVAQNKATTLGVRLQNVGTQPCTVWDARVEGDAFSLGKLRPFTSLAPGEGVYLQVVFRPPGLGRYTGMLRANTSGVGLAELDVPLSGGSDDACLWPEPPFLNFGGHRVDCGPAELTGAWRNICTHPVDVTDITFGESSDPTAFSMVATSPVPTTLQPDELVTATIHYDPNIPGYNSAALFAKGSDAPLPLLLPVSGDAIQAADHDELYVQPTPAKVDMLWVVDNTASMDDERGHFAQSIAAFLAYADQKGLDYHIGVTTTGIGPPPPGTATEACPGGVDGGESGRLFPVDHSRPRIVDPSMPDRVQILSDNVQVGGCHSIEQGFEAARLALSPPLVDNADDGRTPEPMDGNLGLLRPDASLAIVVASDEDDGSPYDVPTAVQQLRALKPTSPISFSAIVAPQQNCPSAVDPGLRYLEAVQDIGGVSASVCDDDWSPALEQLADQFFKARTVYVLEAQADPASIEVTLDGVPSTDYTYDAPTHAVIFNTAPTPGTKIHITYKEPCP